MVEEALCLVLAERQADFYRYIAGELEDMLFMQFAVATEARDRTKGRAAMDPHLLGFFKQPFISEDSTAVLLDVESGKAGACNAVNTSGKSQRALKFALSVMLTAAGEPSPSSAQNPPAQ